jgi:dTDP-4-dehydrorhamnose reductase
METPVRALVTGGTGLLGKALTETCPRGSSLIVLHLSPLNVRPALSNELVADVRDRTEMDRVFGSQKFDVVIHAAGLSNVDYVQHHYAEAVRSNLFGTANVLECGNRFRKHLIYVSTNAVFDGTRAPYREGDPTCPLHAYGRIKELCEELVAKSAHSYSIVRPILMYGWNYPSRRPNLVTWLLERLGRREEVPVVTDVSENPLFYLQVGDALWKLVERHDIQLVHLGGAETVSRYEIALAVARAFDLDAGLIRPVNSGFFPELVPRPRNTSFVTERMEKELGVAPWSIAQGLQVMKERMRKTA